MAIASWLTMALGRGFTVSIARYLDTGLTVIVMTNLDEDNSKPDKIVDDVARIYLK
jgi:hypothetical protein